MERKFDEALNLVKEKIIRMANRVEEMIENAVKSINSRDPSLIERVFTIEKEINHLQIELDDNALKLIALHQPAAGDLRLLVTAIKISSDLERMGDQAVNIAERAQDIIRVSCIRYVEEISKMADLTQSMVSSCVKAFLEKDDVLALEVCKKDDEVDSFNVQIFKKLIGFMRENPENITPGIWYMLVARHLERIADHATNIGEEVYYIVKGKDIRHHIEENSQ